METLEKVWNMFKVNNKNTKTTSNDIFHTFSSVSIVDFEQLNVSWVCYKSHLFELYFFLI